jgi:hypothetical protein
MHTITADRRHPWKFMAVKVTAIFFLLVILTAISSEAQSLSELKKQ